MGSLFSSPTSQYTMVGRWPGAQGLQKGLISSLMPYVGNIGQGLGAALGSYANMLNPSYTNVTLNPNLMAGLNSVMSNAEQYYNRGAQNLAAQMTMSGNAPGFSTGAQKALTDYSQNAAQNIANTGWQFIEPMQQQLLQQQYGAGGQLMNAVNLFTSLAGTAGGTPVQNQYGASPFMQLLGAAMPFFNLGGGGAASVTSPFFSNTGIMYGTNPATGGWLDLPGPGLGVSGGIPGLI